MRIAILGCGPAGLLAAHAAQMLDVEFDIFSKKGKSDMFGAQYLHEPIPGISLPEPELINYHLMGTHSDYKAKVYGAKRVHMVSPDQFLGEHYAWDIRACYDILWTYYGKHVQQFIADPSTPYDELELKYDIVINSMPRALLCQNPLGHRFELQKVWAAGEAPEMGQFLSDFQVSYNTIICNGRAVPSWYRAANIMHVKTIEWPVTDGRNHGKPPVRGVAQVSKPISTNCDCWPNIRHIGRYGEWRKGVLVHHAYQRAEGFIKGLL